MSFSIYLNCKIVSFWAFRVLNTRVYGKVERHTFRCPQPVYLEVALLHGVANHVGDVAVILKLLDTHFLLCMIQCRVKIVADLIHGDLSAFHDLRS